MMQGSFGLCFVYCTEQIWIVFQVLYSADMGCTSVFMLWSTIMVLWSFRLYFGYLLCMMLCSFSLSFVQNAVEF